MRHVGSREPDSTMSSQLNDSSQHLMTAMQVIYFVINMQMILLPFEVLKRKAVIRPLP